GRVVPPRTEAGPPSGSPSPCAAAAGSEGRARGPKAAGSGLEQRSAGTDPYRVYLTSLYALDRECSTAVTIDCFRCNLYIVSGFDIVAMAASAGGLNALSQVLGALPR